MRQALKIFGKMLNRKQKRRCAGLLVLKVLASFLEYLGLSLIIPAVALLSDAEMLGRFALLEPLLHRMDRSDPGALAADILTLMCGIYLLKNLYLLLVDYLRIRFVRQCRLSVQKQIIDGVLYSPYLQHAQKTTPELMQRLSTDVQGAFRYLENIMQLCAEIAVICVLVALMAWANLPMTAAVIVLFGAVFCAIQLLLKPYLGRESMKTHLLTLDFNKWLLQAVGSMKILKAEHLEDFFADRLKETAAESDRREIRSTFVQTLPRMILELVSICGMLLIASLFLKGGTELSQILTQLAVFALAAIRMLPSISRISGCMNSFSWNKQLLLRTAQAWEEARSLANSRPSSREKAGEEPAPLSWERLELNKVCFQYPETDEWVLEDLDLTIRSGRMIGIIGLSGAGKTTLIDMILGLLPPQRGQVCVDGENLFASPGLMDRWSARVAYIPQSISLLNATVRENVLFGRADRGDEAVWAALEAAQLAEFVRTLPEGLNTKVGEYGLRLSGGQRQRIGIARAFYKQAGVLVFDEATSALDYTTEEKIMELIREWKGRKTALIITHRLEALRCCDEVFVVSGRKAEIWSREQ